MSKYRIYCFPAAFFLWFLILGFDVNIFNVVLAGISGAALYVLAGSFSGVEARKTRMAEATPEDLNGLLVLIDEQARHLHGTSIEPEVLGIRDNLTEIERTIHVHPEQADNSYLRRFIHLYVQYSNGLASDYLSISRMSAPASNLAKTQELYLKRFRLLRSVSEAILNDIYRTQAWGLEAENKALEQVFAPLEQCDDFASADSGAEAM